jgi:hemerythrin
MQRFDWSDSYSVGVKVIDEQHKVWIERLNNLSAAIDAHQEARHISKTLDFMMDYVEFHFAAEERLMEVKHYPGFAQHKLEHQKFRNTLMDLFVMETEETDSVARIADSINNFQISWLKNHIQQVDRQFAAFLNEKSAESSLRNYDPSFPAGPSISNGGRPNCEEATAMGSLDLALPQNPVM